jgi:hypothetical protein
MMMRLRWGIPILFLGGALLAAPAFPGRPAKEKPPPGLDAPADGVEFPAHLTGRGLKMNYGPFISYSVIRRDGARVLDTTLRGLTVRLGRKPVAALCFDPETLRVSAAWTGGYLDISKTNLNGYKGEDLALPIPPIVFTTSAGPGWATTPEGEFKDLRPEFKPAGKVRMGVDLPRHFGALPPEVARYKGLYLHGEKVIFSYTVGKTEVREMPGLLHHDGQLIITRTLHVRPHADTKVLLLCDTTPEAKGLMASEPGPAHLVVSEPDGTLAVGIQGPRQGLQLQRLRSGCCQLRLTPSAAPTTFRVLYWKGRPPDLPRFAARLGAAPDLPDLPALCKGGPPRWPTPVTVKGTLGTEAGPYQVDDIPLPEPNPWRSWVRPGAFDFFADGRAALCSWNGDVWVVSGLDDKLQAVRWRRFATGLFEPLGLKIVDDTVYVLGRDQITRLHDLNGDGEADYYEDFNSSAPVAPTFHGFAMELNTDRAGNFYYSRGAHRVTPGAPLHGGVVKVSRDGRTAELYCTGLREANGMSIGPGDEITAADNQGNWVPSSRIDVIRKGGFYGYNWGTSHTTYEKPLCWIPMSEDNSSGGQAWVTSDRWGPLKGQLLHTSYGTCKLMLVLREQVGGQWQGGVYVFPLEFRSGIMRARFNPADGQLHVCGLKGWQTKAKQDGSFERVRYTGRPAHLPCGLHVKRGAIQLTFTDPLDRAVAETVKSYAVEQWNYRWTAGYGSKDYSVANPAKVGRDPVRVASPKLSADGRTVTLALPELRPVMQMGLTLNLRAADGTPIRTTLYNTINRIP